MSDFVLPSLGADMDAGMVTDWYPEPGGSVVRGQVVGVVETAKGAIDLEIWVDGTIGELHVPLGVSLPVGTVLARVAETGEQLSPARASSAGEAPSGSATPGGPGEAPTLVLGPTPLAHATG